MVVVASLALYFGTYAASAWCLTRSRKKYKHKIDLLFIIAVLLPVLLAALRFNVGTDFENYAKIYEANSKLSFINWFKESRSLDGTRIGVWLISRIAGVFHSQVLFFGIAAFLIYFPIAYSFKKNCDANIIFVLSFAFLLGPFSTGLNTIKQAIAISVLFLGYKYIYKRSFIKYFIVVLAAMCFHVTAAVGIIPYFICNINFLRANSKNIIIWLAILLIGAVGILILYKVGGRFAGYFDYSGQINNRTFFIFLCWLIVFIFFKNKYIQADKRNLLLINTFLIGVLLSLTGFISPYIKRIASYYTFVDFLLIAQLPSLSGKNSKWVKALVLLYFIGMFILSYVILGQADLIPYHFIR